MGRALRMRDATSVLGPEPVWNGKVITVSVRRMLALYVTGVLIGVAGGVALSWGLWGVSLAFS